MSKRFRQFSATYCRLRKKGLSLFVLCFILLATKLIVKKNGPFSKSSEMKGVIEYINKEMDRILQLETRAEQNKEFAKLKSPFPLVPIRMTSTTAVFKCTNKEPPVVLKRIIFNEQNGLEEDRMSRRLVGKHLVKTLGSFRTRWTTSSGVQQIIIWIFLEMLDIKVSQKYVQGNEEKIRHIIRDALKGLDEMHSMGIAHLDIKIENIMGKLVDGEVRYHLIDFGYAREMPKEGQVYLPKKNYGTYPYRPPEIMKKHIHGLKSDIWSLGAVAWFLSMKAVLFYYNDSSEVKKDQKAYSKFLTNPDPKKRFHYRPGTSRELKTFIEECMQLDPDARPTAKKLLGHSFISGDRTMSDSKPERKSSSSQVTSSFL